MRHYPHHIADFDRATRHLTRIERSVYRDLLDLYYDTEQQLNLDMQHVCRRIIARTNEESTAVEQVLNEFFTKTPTGWYHDRCEAEIEAYRANTSQKALAGKASAEAKRLKKLQALNAVLTAVEQPLKFVDTESNGESTNQSTINQSTNQPSKAAPRKRTTPPEIPDGVDQQTWADWLTLRSKKNAPVTQTVIKSAIKEAEKAGMHLEQFLQIWCARGSQGLEASWLKDSERNAARSNTPMSFAERDRENNIRRWEEMTGRTHPERDQQFRTIDIGGEDVLAIESN